MSDSAILSDICQVSLEMLLSMPNRIVTLQSEAFKTKGDDPEC